MKFEELMEQYGMLEKKQRIFYPKTLKLSEPFLKALKEEFAIQEKAGMDLKKFALLLNRALQFHINEHKKTPTPK
jgi:hypothetical protein